jgi:hypothetical protein
MQSAVRPAISARLIGSTEGRSRGERASFAIIAKTMPAPGGWHRVTKFAAEASTLMGDEPSGTQRRQCCGRMGPAALRSPPVSS